MSIIAEHMKAKKVLQDVLSGKITSLSEVEKIMGEDPFYKLWAKNIWEYHTTEAPSYDLKIRLPSEEKNKKFRITSDNKFYIVNAKNKEEAIKKAESTTNKKAVLTDTKFKVDWIKIK